MISVRSLQRSEAAFPTPSYIYSWSGSLAESIFVGKYVTGVFYTILYIFLTNITSRVDLAMSVCPVERWDLGNYACLSGWTLRSRKLWKLCPYERWDLGNYTSVRMNAEISETMRVVRMNAEISETMGAKWTLRSRKLWELGYWGFWRADSWASYAAQVPCRFLSFLRSASLFKQSATPTLWRFLSF